MTAPLITTLEPASGPTGGKTLVTLTGDGFRLPPAPPPSAAPLGPPSPTVQVLVGGQLAEDVRIIDATKLSFLTPRGEPGDADLVVRNLDDDGAPIPGEEATAPGAFTFVRPALAPVILLKPGSFQVTCKVAFPVLGSPTSGGFSMWT